MKQRRFSLTGIFLLAGFIALYLGWDYLRGRSELKVVTISSNACDFETTEIVYFNCTRSWQLLGSKAQSCDTVALPVAEGDLVMFPAGEEYSGSLRYRDSDGKHLNFDFDTMYPGAAFMDGKLVSLLINDDFTWEGDMKEGRLKELRSIRIGEDPVSDAMYGQLERIARVNPDPGLYIESESREDFQRILSLFKPEWMVLPGHLLDSTDGMLLKNLGDLELLYLAGTDSLEDDLLSRLPDLESLIIDCSGSSETGSIPLGEIRDLKSLTLVGCDLTSLSALDLPQNLKELYLIYSESITDIEGLRDLPGLRDLSLAGCDSLKEFSVLNEIPGLRWLSLPPGVSQATFNEIITRQTGLQGLELYECEEITDLSSLEKLENLKSLALDLPEIDFGSLKKLPVIELIVINEKHFSDPGDEIGALKQALPQTRIVQGSGFCMGSGWLLLLVPFLFGAVLLRVACRR